MHIASSFCDTIADWLHCSSFNADCLRFLLYGKLFFLSMLEFGAPLSSLFEEVLYKSLNE